MSLATILVGLERRLSGLRRNSVQVGDHRIAYSEGGKSNTETLVLVHGFSSSADAWNRMAAQLTKRYHVIAPDLPGWGESTRIESASYAYPMQIERLQQFVQRLGLTRFHLAGHSMGGGIATRYAARYPEHVITLGLLAPHGLTEPEQSALAQDVARGDNWLVVTTIAGFDRLMDKLFVKRPFVPRSVVKYLAETTVNRSAKTQKIFAEIQVNDPPLLEQLPRIKAPVFIAWGDQDNLIHYSAAELFRESISNIEVLIMKNTGHMPLMENVGQCCTAYMAFLAKARNAREAAA